mmetsp:Transcript_25722/g.67320  ORF Transcript_25722/g.67320 Transcript_25722/m.67320 type:complete len:183 (-) Transcript_25722:168-716(-)
MGNIGTCACFREIDDMYVDDLLSKLPGKFKDFGPFQVAIEDAYLQDMKEDQVQISLSEFSLKGVILKTSFGATLPMYGYKEQGVWVNIDVQKAPTVKGCWVKVRNYGLFEADGIRQERGLVFPGLQSMFEDAWRHHVEAWVTGQVTETINEEIDNVIDFAVIDNETLMSEFQQNAGIRHARG